MPKNYESLYRHSWRSLQSREARFPGRALMDYEAAGLPEALAIRAAEGDAPAEILLYDEIGYFGISAKDFVLALAQAGEGPLVLRINSPGGDVFDGLAIYNALKARKAPVTAVVDGIAASAASFIAMAAGKLEMNEQSMLMIHNAWGLVMGNRHDMLDMAAVMEKIDGQIAAIYAGKSGKPAPEMAAMMDAETWLTSTEAKDSGLCDGIVAPPAKAALSARAVDENFYCTFDALNRQLFRAESLPAYDPDEDGDNDAEEALGHIRSAMTLMGCAHDALAGTYRDDDGDGDGSGGYAEGENTGAAPGRPIVPGSRQRRPLVLQLQPNHQVDAIGDLMEIRPAAAATGAEWVVGAATDLPIDTAKAWDGPGAAERLLDEAGFNGDSPDPAKAKRGFLVWDHHNAKLKGSYKLPFADIVGGKLTALKSGIDAAASRLPQTDIPDSVKSRARDVLDAYEKRMKPEDDGKSARLRRLRVAEAEAA